MTTQCTPRSQSSRTQASWPNGLVAVQDEFDRLFDRFFTGDQAPRSGWLARLDWWEDDHAYHLEFEAPGVKKDEIEITFEKGVLKVTAKREQSEEEKGRSYLHRERRAGVAERRISLPDTANPDTIDAQLNAGVLHVTVGKKEELHPKRIAVKGE